MTVTENDLKQGRIVGIAGPVVDIEFPPGNLPEINTQLEFDVSVEGETINVPAEVAQQIGDNRVRAIAMKPTDGLVRGAPVVNTGHGVQAPVGDGTLGHIWNVMGDCLDVPGTSTDDRWDIHRSAPSFDSLEPSAKITSCSVACSLRQTPLKGATTKWLRRGISRSGSSRTTSWFVPVGKVWQVLHDPKFVTATPSKYSSCPRTALAGWKLPSGVRKPARSTTRRERS